jgi:hypothetical protein
MVAARAMSIAAIRSRMILSRSFMASKGDLPGSVPSPTGVADRSTEHQLPSCSSVGQILAAGPEPCFQKLDDIIGSCFPEACSLFVFPA